VLIVTSNRLKRRHTGADKMSKKSWNLLPALQKHELVQIYKLN